LSVIAIRYKNFMAFRDTGWIELRPICLLFGRNSSGKSAIIRGLRLLKQSLHTEESSSAKNKNALRFALEGQLDLGDFRSALHQHTESANDDQELEAQKITFAFQVEIPDLTAKLWQRIQQAGLMTKITTSELPSYIELHLEFGYSPSNQIDLVRLVGVHLDCPSTIEPDSSRVVFMSAIRSGELIQLSFPDQASRYATIWSDKWYWTSDCGIGEQQERDITGANIDWTEVELVRHFGFLPHLEHKNILRATENLEEVATDYALVEFTLRSISGEISSFLNNIQYLGPMRPKPERVYMLDRFEMEHWRAQGLGAWLEFITTTSDSMGKSDEQAVSNSGRSNQLIESADEKYELLDSTIQKDPEETEETPPKSFQGQMDEWIKTLYLGHEVQVESNPMKNKLGYTPQIYIVKENGKRDNLADVGYGASQVLPIIATCLYAKPESLIIIEQPELHLHPAAQAELGDLLIQTVLKIIEEKYTDTSNVKLLVETHSEHMLLRLRRRIAETAVRRLSSPTGGDRHQIDFRAENLVACFLIRSEEETTVSMVAISDLGEMDKLPTQINDFFSNDLNEVAELTRAWLQTQGISKNRS